MKGFQRKRFEVATVFTIACAFELYAMLIFTDAFFNTGVVALFADWQIVLGFLSLIIGALGFPFLVIYLVLKDWDAYMSYIRGPE